ncbi:MAG: DUF3458 domain-containing protein [Pseudomonadota bacterium]
MRDGALALTLRQSVPATPGQPDKAPMPIPLRVAVHSRASGATTTKLIVMPAPMATLARATMPCWNRLKGLSGVSVTVSIIRRA